MITSTMKMSQRRRITENEIVKDEAKEEESDRTKDVKATEETDKMTEKADKTKEKADKTKEEADKMREETDKTTDEADKTTEEADEEVKKIDTENKTASNISTEEVDKTRRTLLNKTPRRYWK